MNLLFTSAGRRVVKLKLFRDALEQSDARGVIVAADTSDTAPAFHAADYAYTVPRISDPDYIPSLLRICKKHQINAIFPCFDPDLDAIAEARGDFEKTGAFPVLSPTEAIHITYSKLATYHFFVEHNVPTVRTTHIKDFDSASGWEFPLFAKPITGFGSRNSHPVNSLKDLEVYQTKVPDAVIQELATGTEITLDVLADFDGNVLSVVPRQRIEVRAGEISKGVTRKNWVLIEWAQKITKALKAIGPLCIQCFVEGDKVLFTEINPRFGGGMPLSVAAGANQVLWAVQLLQGQKLHPRIGDFQENFVMLRYDDAYFMPEADNQRIPHA